MVTTALNVYEARVRTHQTDMNASMYHAAYFDLFDDARIEMFRRMGYTYERMRRGEWTAVIRHIECDFRLPAFMDDLLTVIVTVPRMTAATMTIRYECRRGEDNLAMAHAVFAFIRDDGRPLRMPSDLREVVEQHAALVQPVGTS